MGSTKSSNFNFFSIYGYCSQTAYIINHQSSIINHQSSIINHQSSIINHQSSIINHQSSIINHHPTSKKALINKIHNYNITLYYNYSLEHSLDMGIHNMMPFIKRYAGKSIKQTVITDYANKRVAIDANLMIYKNVYAIRKHHGDNLKNNDIITTHIHSMILKLAGFHKYNIKPIFVFDGIPPKIKHLTLDKRDQFRRDMMIKYQNAKSVSEKKKYYYIKSDITSDEISDVIELINIFGYQVVESVGEADIMLAQLNMMHVVDYVVSDDMDILVFGATNLLKDFSVDIKKVITEIDLNKLKKITGFSQAMLVDLAILLGCDYCATVRGIGLVGAHDLIDKYGNLENIAKKEGITLPQDYKGVQKYFKIDKQVDINKFDDSDRKVDAMGLKAFLKRFNYNNKYIHILFCKLCIK